MRTDTAVRTALHELVTAAAAIRDDVCGRAGLAVVVLSLECSAGGSLGTTDGDPLVVLQRRLGRAHRLLETAGSGALAADDVRGHLVTLCSRPQVTRRACRAQRDATAGEPLPVAC